MRLEVLTGEPKRGWFAARLLTVVLLAGVASAEVGHPASAADAPPSLLSPSLTLPPRPPSSWPAFTWPAWPGPRSGPTLRVGAYVGQLTTGSLPSNLLEPWTITLRDSYLVDVHAIYTVYRFTRLPLDLEIEGGVAHRFGMDHQAEVDLIPVARWTWFPWNNFLYTNLRLGFFGASYVSSISPTELQRSGTNHGSRYLNFLVPEWTFSSGPDAGWEVFVRIHHRSGIYGLIDGVYGGSNYLSVGARFGVF